MKFTRLASSPDALQLHGAVGEITAADEIGTA